MESIKIFGKEISFNTPTKREFKILEISYPGKFRRENLSKRGTQITPQGGEKTFFN